MASNKPIFLKTRFGEAKSPDIVRLYGGRMRVTRYLDRGQMGEVPPELLGDYGTADIANVEDYPELADLCFVDTGFADAPGATKKWLTLVYETLTDELVDEVAPEVGFELNGLKRITRQLVALPGTSYAFVQGASTQEGCTLGQLSDKSTDFATRLTLVFLEPGQISQSDDYQNNDKLHLRNITSFGQVPDTPSGFVLVGTQASEVEGIPTRTYRFAKGVGEISRDPQSSNNGKLLTVGIRRLSAPDATLDAATFAAGSGFVLVSGPSYQEADGHRVWSASFAKGVGIVARGTRARGDGLIEASFTIFDAPGYTRTTLPSLPAGVLIAFTDRDADGYATYDVTLIQSAAGGSPEAVTYSYGSQRRFQAPGRLKAQVITKTILTPGEVPTSYTFRTLALNKSAPVVFEALAVTVSITYQSSNAVGTVSPAQWDPQQWATVDADIILTGPIPRRRVQDYPGYVVDDASGTSTASFTATAASGSAAYVFGDGDILFQGNNVHTLTVAGPVYPSGQSRTIEPVRLEPDFQALDGTKWYKRTQVSATLPTLPAMPTLA